MFVPTSGRSAAVGRVVEDLGALIVVEHVAMLLAMLGAMLLRPSEYTTPRARAAQVTA